MAEFTLDEFTRQAGVTVTELTLPEPFGGLFDAQHTIMMGEGRASFLGERSIGHMDPGARSSEILITAVCDVLEGQS